MLILLLVALVVVILVTPIWPYSAGWGRRPAAIVAIVTIILLIILLSYVKYIEIDSDEGETTIKIEKRVSNR